MNRRFRLPHIVLFEETGLEQQTIHALKLMIIAVAFGTVSFNITGGVAMTGYLKALGTSDFVFGLLYAIGPIAAPLQLAASLLLERTRKRKAIFITTALIYRMTWLPFGLVPFFVPMEQPVLRIWMVSLFLCITAMMAPFLNVTFFSLAADIVPEKIRGRYFAVRSRVATLFGIAGGFLTAWLLDSFTGFHSYALVFTLAAVTGTADILVFFAIKFPPMAVREKNEKFLKLFLDVLKNKHYMKFVMFMTIWMFTMNISTPFYNVHMRNEVGYSNTFITFFVQILPNLCSFMFVTGWGRTIDKHGNKTAMYFSSSVWCVILLVWAFTVNNAVSVVLIAFSGLMQGLMMPGFDLGANNMMMGHAPREGRSMYIAVYLMVTSMIGVGLAYAAGGWLLDNVFSVAESANLSIPGVRFTRYHYIFGLTAFLRVLTVYIALPRMLHEDGNTPVREMLKDIFKRRKRFRRL